MSMSTNLSVALQSAARSDRLATAAATLGVLNIADPSRRQINAPETESRELRLRREIDRRTVRQFKRASFI